MTPFLTFLKGIPLFRGLSNQDLAAVARIAKPEAAAEGKILFAKDARGDSLYIVLKGAVKIFSKSSTGKSKTFAYLESKDFFGEMALLGAGLRSASALALEPSTLLVIHRGDFEALLKRRPQLSVALLRALCERLERADREIENFSFNTVLGRTAQLLLDLAKRYGEKTPKGLRIKRRLSHRELADLAGTAREMISRVLSRFARTGCLTTDGERITLTDPAKLKGWIL